MPIWEEDRSNDHLLDLRVDPNDYPHAGIVESYQQSVSQPKDWRSSLPKWEQEVASALQLDNPRQGYSAPLSDNYGNSAASEDLRNPSSISIYQLPMFNGNGNSAYDRTKNSNHPIDMKEQVKDFLKEVGEDLYDDMVEPIVGIWKDPKSAFQSSYEASQHLNPLDPMAGVGDLVGEAAKSKLQEFLDGNAAKRTAVGIEVGGHNRREVGSERGILHFSFISA